MKKIFSALLLSGVFLSANATEYVLTANTLGKDFAGFNPTADVNKFTSVPEIPPTGITTADSVVVRGFYDYTPLNIEVENFTYVSVGSKLGGSGSGMSFKYNVTRPITLKAKNITFKYNDVDINDSSNDLDATFLNIFNNTVTFQGNMTLANGGICVGLSYNGSNSGLVLDAYDAQTPTTYNMKYITFAYKSAGTKTFSVKDGVTANVDAINFSTTAGDSADARNTIVSLDGGFLNLKSVSFVQRDGDSITINHDKTVLGANGNLNFGQNIDAGALKYNLSENSIFNTNGNVVTIANGTTLGAMGAKAGLSVKGGGTLVLSCGVSAINGNIIVADASTLDLNTSWVSNAQSITISSNSTITTAGEISLSGASNIILEVGGLNDFATITGASVSSSDGSFGNLIFNLQEGAFGAGTSLSIALGDIIDAGTVDWNKFNISANYDYVLSSDKITFSVPEPATYAAIFGAMALVFAAYRRRK